MLGFGLGKMGNDWKCEAGRCRCEVKNDIIKSTQQAQAVYPGIPDNEPVVAMTLEYSTDPDHHAAGVTTTKSRYRWNGTYYEKE